MQTVDVGFVSFKKTFLFSDLLGGEWRGQRLYLLE